MSWLENLGLILVLLVVTMAFLTITRIDRAITYWFWAWVCQLAGAAAFGALGESSTALAVASGVVLLAPTLHLSGAISYSRQMIPHWIFPIGLILGVVRAMLYGSELADVGRILATLVELAAYSWAIAVILRRGSTMTALDWCLAFGFGALAGVEVYDAAVEISTQAEILAWAPWVVVGVFMGATQILIAFRLARNGGRTRDEIAARTAVDRFDALVHHSKDMVAEVGPDGRLSYVSPNVEQLMGYSPDELVGRSLSDILVPARSSERTGSADAIDLGNMIASGPYDTLHKTMSKGGEDRWLEIQASHYFTPNGEIRAVATIRDVTEREMLQRQHMESQNLESLGVLAGGVAHDFNNLLTAIVGNANIARASIPAHSDAHAPLAQIEKAAERAAELTRKLLAYAGKTPLNVKAIDVREVVDEMRHLLAAGISKKANIQWERPSTPMLALADPTLLMQVIMNLMTNASEALEGEPGNIWLAVSQGSVKDSKIDSQSWAIAPEPGEYVTVSVTDDGAGMDEETQRRLFDPFFSRKFIGRGLGLSAVLGIVRDHAGALQVETRLGEGSTFTVLLPRAMESAAVADRDRQANTSWRGEGLALLVDDEEVVRTVLERMLTKIGFEPVSASNGAQALEVIRDRGSAIKFVLLDATMPGMSLEETINRIRDEIGDIPILLMSGYTESEVVISNSTNSIAGFVQKPFRIDVVADAIRGVLDNASEIT